MKRRSLFIIGYISNWALFLGCCFMYFRLNKGLILLIINLVILALYSYMYFLLKSMSKKVVLEFYKQNEEFFKKHNINTENIKMYDFIVKMLDILDINSQYSNEDKVKARKVVDFIKGARPEYIDVVKNQNI